MITKVAIYARVSSPQQLDGYSLDVQLQEMSELAKREDWEIVHEYVEKGYSAKTDQRPEFRRLVRRHADVAEPALLAGADLEAVAVDELHRRVRRHHEIAVVDVADDMAAVVDHREGARGVGGGVDEEGPARRGKFLEAQLRAVEVEGRLVAGDAGHQEAHHRPAAPAFSRTRCHRQHTRLGGRP